MNILALDPGPTQTAYIQWDCLKIAEKQIYENDHLLTVLALDAKQRYVDRLCIEMIGHYGTGMAVGAEVFDTCVWIGRFMQQWIASGRCDKPVILLKRNEIKMHLCQSMRAKDANIRQALLDRFGGKDAAIGKKASPGPLYGIHSHEWSALAVAVTCYDLLNQEKTVP